MSTMESASSLFGPSDSGSDFLTAEEAPNSAIDSPSGAAEGVVGQQEHESQEQDATHLFDNAVAPNNEDSASSLFADAGTDFGSSLFDGVVDLGYGCEEQPQIVTESQAHAYGYDQDAYPSGSYVASNGTYDQTSAGWYDEHGQWQTANQGGYYDQYGQWQTTDSTYASHAPQQEAPAYSYGAGQSSHGNMASQNYAASASQAYAYQPATAYTPVTTPKKQGHYDPYIPPVPSLPSQTVAASAKTASVYDPYKPATTSTSQLSSAQQSTTTPFSYNAYAPQPNITLPASSSALAAPTSFRTSAVSVKESKTIATPYRPPTSNAYDPPIPSKPKRSMTANVPRSPMSAFGAAPPLPTLNAHPPPRSESVPIPALGSGLPPAPPRSPSYQVQPPSRINTLSPPSGLPRARSPYDPLTAERSSNAPASAPPSRITLPIGPGPQSTSSTLPNGLPRSASPYDPPLVSRSFAHPPSREPAHQRAVNENSARRSLSPQDNHAINRVAPSAVETVAEAIGGGEDELWDPESGEDSRFSSAANAQSTIGLPEVTSASRSQSPHTPSAPPKAHQHPLSETRRTSSPDVGPRSGVSQRTASPLSDSGRSTTSSIGRASPVHSFHNRNGTITVGQSFSALEDMGPYPAGPYSTQGQNPSDGPSTRVVPPIGSLNGHGGPKAIPNHQAQTSENVIDLASEEAPYGHPTSPSSQRNASSFEPYAPPVSQTGSPATFVAPPLKSKPANPYTPSSDTLNTARPRSITNTSNFSAASSGPYDQYAPATRIHARKDSSPTDAYTIPPAGPTFTGFTSSGARMSMEKTYSPPPVTGPYAPSPSLLGTNDPLGRAKARVPVFSFGFGGKLVTCFHTSPTYETGFDVALSSRKCTDVHIRTLHKIIPESALEVSSAQYPGPLVGDPGSPISTLMKTATTASAKKSKKSKVLNYLDLRVEEMERGLNYLSEASATRRRAEGKLSLMRLLRVLVEYDGQLRSNQVNEMAVRAALMPRLSDSSDSRGANAYLNAPTAADIASGSFAASSSNERPVAEYAVRPSALSTLQDFLLRGEKRKAFHYALDEKMWAHAMVISSSVDKEAFKDVVTEFIRTELGVRAGDTANGLESLRLAYSLYSGQSSTAVQHLFPIKSLQAGPMLTLQPPTPMGNNFMTPLSPNFPSPSQANGIPANVLSQWPEYAVMLFSGQMGPESSSSLTTLGDYLLANDWIEAAHCCYLLSPMTSPINGVGSPSVRMVLVGCQSPHRNTSFATDPDAFIFSEILEYALSLHTPVKGQDAFTGFSHLQVYRLIRAMQYADLGHVTLAKRYLDAISGSVTRPSPFLSQQVSDLVRDFYGRINGETELIKSGSWITNKIAKPSLNGIGDWIGGSLSKFVAGEDEPQSPDRKEASLSNNPAYAGAFQNFSNISSANTSRGPSPAPSLSQSYGRPSLSMDRSISNASYGRSPSSSFDVDSVNMRGTPPPPRMSLDSHATRQSDHEHVGNDYASPEAEASKQQSGGWWGSAYGDGSGPTPTATSFVAVDGSKSSTPADSSGFISLMDSVPSFTPSPSAATFTSSRRNDASEDFDDDLGLGNPTNKKNAGESAREGETRVEEQKKATTKPDIKPMQSSSSSGSWLGRWFSRTPSNASSPGPVRANLGEETSFYYDKDLKRWVNKRVGSEPEKSAAAPPPSRAQTASPSRAMGNMSHGPPPASPLPPPNRPFSAMDSNFGSGLPSAGPPRKPVHRIPSNLNPESAKDVPLPPTPSTPAAMAHLTAAPPTGRPKSAAKKSVRSRYVDVFQQP